MADNSKIEWTDATWNPVRARLPEHIGMLATAEDDVTEAKVGTHCERVSEGCRNCYAETFNRRGLPGAGTGLDYKPGHRDKLEHFLDEKMLLAPLRRKKPTRYFLSSLTDVFGAWVTDDMLDRLFAVMALCPQHVFQVLTKRPERARAYLTEPTMRGRLLDEMDRAENSGSNAYTSWPLPNVWLGTSVEDQAAADARIPHLLAMPAAVRFLSCEPLLGRVAPWTVKIATAAQALGADVDSSGGARIDWVIVGGESGKGARPMHPEWARQLRSMCALAAVPFFFKQWGEFSTIFDRDVEDPDWRNCGRWPDQYPKGRWHNLAGGTGFHGDRVVFVDRVGKAKAGRLLDGIEHNGMPA